MKTFGLFLVIVLGPGAILPLLAVEVDEDNTYVIIETEGYRLHWKKAATMGYMQAFVAGSEDTLIEVGGRSYYHADNYAGGWKAWGTLSDWEIVEQELGKVVVKYESRDAGTKKYTYIATYYDNVPYIKHEVTITNVGDAAVMSFANGHDPMFEPNSGFEGMKAFKEPFPHAAYWTREGYFAALYAPEAASARTTEWQGSNPGRMDILHDNLGRQLKKDDSAIVIYYTAFGEGGEKEATALAEDVQKEPPKWRSVSPVGRLAVTWASIKAQD